MKANMGVTVVFPIFMNPVFLIARGGSDLRISRASTKRQHHINHDKKCNNFEWIQGTSSPKGNKNAPETSARPFPESLYVIR
jgi:hypothetical protein